MNDVVTGNNTSMHAGVVAGNAGSPGNRGDARRLPRSVSPPSSSTHHHTRPLCIWTASHLRTYSSLARLSFLSMFFFFCEIVHGNITMDMQIVKHTCHDWFFESYNQLVGKSKPSLKGGKCKPNILIYYIRSILLVAG
jgi:hypothetical protein